MTESKEEQQQVLTEKVVKFLESINAEVRAVVQVTQDGRLMAVPFVTEKQDEESSNTDTGSSQTEGRDKPADSTADVPARSNPDRKSNT